MMKNDITKGIGIPVYKILVFIWISVSVILMTYKVMQYFKFTKGIRKLYSRTSTQILTCKQVVEKEIGEIRAELICSKAIKAPMCMGLIKRLILLPDRSYKEDELYYILKHEYTHLKNKDIHVKVLIEVFIVLLWWNPFVYLLRHDLGHVLEIRCDLAVIGEEVSQKKPLMEYIIPQLPFEISQMKNNWLSNLTQMIFVFIISIILLKNEEQNRIH
ncbi:M56 family metallopeptidase [Lachnospiraceae bacterium ZAX-1]